MDKNVFKEDPQLTKQKKEALITTGLFLVQAVIMIIIPYAMGSGKAKEEILSTLVLGLPAWYIYGVAIPTIVFTVIAAFIIKKYLNEDKRKEE